MAASLATNAPPPRRDPWRLWAGDAVFLEAALGLRRALLSIGVDAAVDVGADGAAPWTQKPGHRWILVGATRAPGVAPSPAPWPWPEYYVVYQLEQLDSAWLTPRYLALLHGAAVVWDFAPAHVPRWRATLQRVAYVPLAPPPPPPPSLDLAPRGADVLFYGCGNARRQALEAAVRAAVEPRGFTVMFRLDFGLFGAEREAAIRGCRVALNAHYYPRAALETHRINYLLGLGCCVVSEPSADAELDALYEGAVVFAALEDIPARVVELLEDEGAVAAVAARGIALADELVGLAAARAREALPE